MSGASEDMGVQQPGTAADGNRSPVAESSPLGRSPLPVTDGHVRAAWFDYHARPAEFGDIPILPPEHPAMWRSDLTLAALRRVLEADRRRMLEQRGASS